MIEGETIKLGGAMGYGSRNLSPEMRATLEPAFALIATRLHEYWLKKGGSDRARFSLSDIVHGYDIGPDKLDRLVALGILGVVKYASGAWQYAFTPYTRTWFFMVMAKFEKAKT